MSYLCACLSVLVVRGIHTVVLKRNVTCMFNPLCFNTKSNKGDSYVWVPPLLCIYLPVLKPKDAPRSN